MNSSPSIPNRRDWQKPFFIALVFWSVLACTGAFFLNGARGSAYCLGATAFLAFGFKLTEVLVGVMTGVAKANRTAIALIFGAKLLWWGLIFYSLRMGVENVGASLALGVAAFLFAILTAGLKLAGMPKISFKQD